MYCDLYLPFPTSSPGAGPSTATSTKKGKGKAAAAQVQQTGNRTCWEGLPQKEKEDADKVFAIAGHCEFLTEFLSSKNSCCLNVYADRFFAVGYTLVANSIPSTRSTAVPPNPFSNEVPYPQLDPRYSETTAGSRRLVQLSRLTITLDDSSQHGLVSFFELFPVSLSDNLALRIAERNQYVRLVILRYHCRCSYDRQCVF